jgi:hypothetical protein
MTLIAFLGFAGKIGNFKYPFVEIRESYPVDLGLAKIIPESFIQFHGYILVIIPMYWGLESHCR